MPVTKVSLSRRERWLRFLAGVADPRAWLHGLKLLNFYNHAHVRPLRRIRRGDDCQISPTATFAHADRICFGSRVLIGEGCRIWAGPSTGGITIGSDTMLGPGVLLTAASYRFRDGTPTSRQLMDEADVVVGADVWIGAHSIILPGARIGDGAVVAAGSVVRREVPPMSVVAGVPARVRGQRDAAAAEGAGVPSAPR